MGMRVLSEVTHGNSKSSVFEETDLVNDKFRMIFILASTGLEN